MKKWLPLIVIVVLGVVLYSWVKGIYNNGVIYQEDAKTTWSNVESSYQRRADLIGNLVKTVQGAADFEKSTLTAVIDARAKATSTKVDAANLTGAELAKFQQAQSGLTAALGRLMVVVERYPDLKASKNFLELQSQLEGTENRINVARNRYNESVNVYNKHIKVFPNNLFAGLFGLEAMTRYEADKGSENAVDVNFNFDDKKKE